MYGELASVKGIVDLSPQDALDSAEGFLASQGYIIEQRTFTTVFAQRQAEVGEDLFSLTVAVAPQAGGGVRVTIRGTDEAGIRERQAAWSEWSESLPKKPEPADVPLSAPPQVDDVDLPTPPQVERDFATTAQATPQEGRRTGLGNPYLLGCLGLAGLVFFVLVVAAVIGAVSGGEVAEKPKQERRAGQQEPPEKKEQPRQESQTQGGQQEPEGGGEQEPKPQEPKPQEPKPQKPEPAPKPAPKPQYASEGAKVTVDDEAYQVTNSWKQNGIHSALENLEGTFVAVDFTFYNMGSDPRTLDESALKLKDSQGRSYDVIQDNMMVVPMSKDIFLEDVSPGVSKQGRAYFSVAPTASGFVLVCSHTNWLSSAKPAQIRLAV